MPRGSKPGEHRGGRVRGTPNRQTTEKELMRERVSAHVSQAVRAGRTRYQIEQAAEAVAAELQEAQKRGPMLAKERLDEAMQLFFSMATVYQPRPGRFAEAFGPNPDANEEKFQTYMRLGLEAAKALAPFQSPTLRAVFVTPPEPEQRGPTRFTLQIFDRRRGETLIDVEDDGPLGGVIDHDEEA